MTVDRETQIKTTIFKKENNKFIAQGLAFDNAKDAENYIKQQENPSNFIRGPQGGCFFIYVDNTTDKRYLLMPHREDLKFLAYYGSFDVNAGVGVKTTNKKIVESWTDAVLKELGQETLAIKDGEVLIPKGKYNELVETEAKNFLQKAEIDLQTKNVDAEFQEVGEEIVINWNGYNTEQILELLTGFIAKENYSLEIVKPVIIHGKGIPTGMVDLEGRYVEEKNNPEKLKWEYFNRNTGIIDLQTLNLYEYKFNKETNKSEFIEQYNISEKQNFEKCFFTVKAFTGLLNTLYNKKLGGNSTKDKKYIKKLFKKLASNPEYEKRYGVKYNMEFKEGKFGEYISVFTTQIKK